MKITSFFNELSKTDTHIAGGKGASLGEMTQAGIPVPPGFVVLTDAFEHFLDETDLHEEIQAQLDQVNHRELESVERASENIQALIHNAKMPEDIKTVIYSSFDQLGTEWVAVRSSATAEDGADASWAGELDSFLNTSRSDLLNKVQRCWASLFTPRAIFYRFEKGFHTGKVSVAVVVQKMVASEVSGIAFSVHPVTEDPNQLIIEAGFGLGEAIVSGSVTPDNYVIDKRDESVVDTYIAKQEKALYRKAEGGNEWVEIEKSKGGERKLGEEKTLELARIVINIERHYGFPCDIEWAKEGEDLFIVQSRPITTLGGAKEPVRKEDGPTYVAGQEWILSVTRNMSFWHQGISAEGHYHNMRDFGVEANLRQLHLTANGTKTTVFMFQPNLSEYNGAVMERVNSEEKIQTLKSTYQEKADELFAALDACHQNLDLNTWDSFIDKYRRFTPGLMITATIGRVGGEVLAEKLKSLGRNEEEIPALIAGITYPSEHTPLFSSQLDLLRIGREIQGGNQSSKEELLRDWLEKYQSIPVNFCEEAWTMQDALQQLNQILQKDCAEEMSRLEASHSERVERATSLRRDMGDSEVAILATAVAEGTYLNEFRKNVFCRVSLSYRPLMSKIAEKAGSNNWRDCFYLTNEEIRQILQGNHVDIAAIKSGRELAGGYTDESGQLVLLTDEECTKLSEHVSEVQGKSRSQSSDATTISGFSANAGKITGIARLVFNSKDFHKLQTGDILVTTMTSVDFVPVMEKAGAFVTNEGGITSHASIVAREMGKPCIIGTKNATQVIQDGDTVEVNANTGVVTILERAGFEDYIFMWSTSPGTIIYWASPSAIQKRKDIILEEDVSFLAYFDGELCTSYIPESDLENIRQKVSPWFAVPENFSSYRNKYLEEKRQWWEWVRKAEQTDFSSLSAEELRPWYEHFTLNFYDAIGHFWTSRPEWTFSVEERLKTVLKKHFGDDWTDVLGELVTATELDDIQKQQLALLELLESQPDDAALLRHISEFPWLVFGQYDESAAVQFVRERFEDFAGKTLTEERQALDAVKSKLKADQEEILNKLGEDREYAAQLADFLKTQAHERMEIKAYWAGCFYLCRNLLKRIAEVMQISLSDVSSYITPDEILDFLAGNISGSQLQESIAARKKAYAIIRPKGGSIQMLSGDEATEYFKKKVKGVESGVEVIKGQTAAKGLYRGKIRKVIAGDLEDLQNSIKDFQQGEILVTSMTQPNMMVIANKAGAIITDEGGITSHAAIISRELRIPCVVGCLHAMQVLNDGDVVEVDANNGIVKIIK